MKCLECGSSNLVFERLAKAVIRYPISGNAVNWGAGEVVRIIESTPELDVVICLQCGFEGAPLCDNACDEKEEYEEECYLFRRGVCEGSVSRKG